MDKDFYPALVCHCICSTFKLDCCSGVIAYRFAEKEKADGERESERWGRKEDKTQRMIGRGAKRRGERKEKTQWNSATFPCQRHSVQSNVVDSPSALSPWQLAWILIPPSRTTSHIYYKWVRNQMWQVNFLTLQECAIHVEDRYYLYVWLAVPIFISLIKLI